MESCIEEAPPSGLTLCINNISMVRTDLVNTVEPIELWIPSFSCFLKQTDV